MSRHLTIVLLSAALGCAAAPVPEPDAVEPCGATAEHSEAARRISDLHALYGAESLCRAPGAGRRVRLTLGAPFTYDSAAWEPIVRVEFDPEGRTGEVHWRAHRFALPAPLPLVGSGTLQLSAGRLAALRRAISALEVARDDSTECIHCQSVVIEERRGGAVAWFSRPQLSLEGSPALATLRREVLAAQAAHSSASR